jgi:hypothetical protein
VDPDPDWESGSKKGKTYKKIKKLGISCFAVLDVLFNGLEASPVA